MNITRFGAMLTGGDRDRQHLVADASVPEHVVGVSGLLDPCQAGRLEGVDPWPGLMCRPHLVGVDSEADRVADRLPSKAGASNVIIEIGTDLELDLAEAIGNDLLGQPGHLLVAVAEPARGRRIGRVSVAQQRLDPFGACRGVFTQNRQRVISSDGVLDVVEGHRLDHLSRVHLGEEQPQRPTGNSSAQVPHGVEQRARRHVDDPLLGSQPAKLRVADGRRPQLAGTGDHGVDRSAEHDVGDGVDRHPLDLVATPDRERKRVTGQTIDVGAQHEVRGRVVRVRVHRVRSVEHRRGREPNVERVSSDDGRHVAPLPPSLSVARSIAQTPDVCCENLQQSGQSAAQNPSARAEVARKTSDVAGCSVRSPSERSFERSARGALTDRLVSRRGRP